jgi:GntR family transcriptional regulator
MLRCVPSVAYVPELDRDSNVPLHQQLAAILRAQIESGQIPPHRAIPSRTTLQQEYGLASGTVDKTIRMLRDEGLIETVKGMGNYVLPPGERRVWPAPPAARATGHEHGLCRRRTFPLCHPHL